MKKHSVPIGEGGGIRSSYIKAFAAGAIIAFLMVSVVFVAPYFMKAYAAGNINKPLTEATSKQVFYLTFDEPLNAGTISTVNIQVLKEGVSQTVYGVYLMPDQRVVKGILASSMVSGSAYSPVTYWVYLSNIEAISGNTLTTNSTVNTPAPSFEAFTPHGKYSPASYTSGGNTRLCGLCHLTHRASGTNLLSGITIQKVCFVCHGPGAGRPAGLVEPDWTVAVNVYDEFYRAGSIHKALDTSPNDVLTCIECHNPHGDRTGVGNDIYPKLLKSTVGESVYFQGNNFCLACHGGIDKAFPRDTAYWTSTGGDHSWGMDVDGNKDVAGTPIPHYDYTNFSTFMNPDSGTRVTCVKCHEKHGSDLTRLVDTTLTNVKEAMCYKCHNSSTYNSMSNINIKAKFDAAETGTVSKHTITDPDRGFTCSSCHGPHTVARRTLASSGSTQPSDISDPANTKNNWYKSAGQDMAGFCNRCHDAASGQTLTAVANSSTIVPYNVYLPTVSFTSNAGGWNKKTYYDYNSGNTNARHYEMSIGCDKCHDPHGESNPRLMNAGQDPNSAPNSTSGMCLRCHGGGATPAGDNLWTNGFSATYRHPTLTVNGNQHTDTENYSTITTTDRHAECYDCHDPHAAQSGNNPSGAPNIQKSLFNISGVNTPARAAGTSIADKNLYTFTNPAAYEWQVCYKCHSSYANLPTGRRDIASEFNPANLSFHFVEGTNLLTHSLATYRNSDRFGTTWGYRSRMYCTDCHGYNAADYNSEPAVKGVHGSANASILKGWWTPATGAAITTKLKTDTTTFLCFRCHNEDYYGAWDGNLSSGSNFPHNGGGPAMSHRVPCWACHGKKVHGKNRNHLVSLESNEDAGAVFAVLDSYTHNSGAYAKGNCSTSGGTINCNQYYTYSGAVAPGH